MNYDNLPKNAYDFEMNYRRVFGYNAWKNKFDKKPSEIYRGIVSKLFSDKPDVDYTVDVMCTDGLYRPATIVYKFLEDGGIEEKVPALMIKRKTKTADRISYVEEDLKSATFAYGKKLSDELYTDVRSCFGDYVLSNLSKQEQNAMEKFYEFGKLSLDERIYYMNKKTNLSDLNLYVDGTFMDPDGSFCVSYSRYETTMLVFNWVTGSWEHLKGSSH
jgi:hypothetical protein